jgi:hypothetical protein
MKYYYRRRQTFHPFIICIFIKNVLRIKYYNYKIVSINYNVLLFKLYDKLREKPFPNFEKLIPISGDVSEKGLGLSAVDRQTLVERVTIIIHAAGDVKFNNSLKYSVFVNTRATRDVCILAQSMKNLLVSQNEIEIMNLNNPVSRNIFCIIFYSTIRISIRKK